MFGVQDSYFLLQVVGFVIEVQSEQTEHVSGDGKDQDNDVASHGDDTMQPACQLDRRVPDPQSYRAVCGPCFAFVAVSLQERPALVK